MPKGRRTPHAATRGRQKASVMQVPPLPWMALFVALLLVIAVSGLALVRSAHDMRGLYQAAADVQREQDSLLSEHSRLLLERSALSSMQNVEQIAERQLSMVFPQRMGEVLKPPPHSRAEGPRNEGSRNEGPRNEGGAR